MRRTTSVEYSRAAQRTGRVLHTIGCWIAVLSGSSLLLAIAEWIRGDVRMENALLLMITSIGLGGASLLAGMACRYVLAGE